MDLSEHITLNRHLAECICQRLSEEINKLGFAATEIKRYPSYDDASFVLIKDPYTGEHNLTCHWYDELNKQRIGRLQFNSDGTFYAEYDVVKPHPGKSRWFVEGVTAWGKAENIKALTQAVANVELADMENPARIYELLLDYAGSDTQVTDLNIGLVWTVCKAQHTGLAMSPGIPTRTLSWPGTLAGKTLAELAGWITDWEPYKATVAMAAINCSLNRYELPSGITLLPAADSANLAVFEHFLPRLQGKKVVVVGRYPGIERYAEQINLSIIERQPTPSDYPDPACEFLLPYADWVFLTASSITNKTFPRLAELAQHATTVLMGPTVPWLPELHEFAIDYLAGVEVIDPIKLYQTAAEGGGVRIFDDAVRYRIVDLTPSNSMTWLKNQIAQDYTDRQQLILAMEQWYDTGKKGRFPAYNQLNQVTTKLSRMDRSYKHLWDVHSS